MSYVGTYHRLNLSVHASKRDVIRAIRRKIRKTLRSDQSYRAARKDLYRRMIDLHTEAQRLFLTPATILSATGQP
jgi:hypothetical protein